MAGTFAELNGLVSSLAPLLGVLEVPWMLVLLDLHF